MVVHYTFSVHLFLSTQQWLLLAPESPCAQHVQSTRRMSLTVCPLRVSCPGADRALNSAVSLQARACKSLACRSSCKFLRFRAPLGQDRFFARPSPETLLPFPPQSDLDQGRFLLVDVCWSSWSDTCGHWEWWGGPKGAVSCLLRVYPR
jgi:hypothetical protein